MDLSNVMGLLNFDVQSVAPNILQPGVLYYFDVVWVHDGDGLTDIIDIKCISGPNVLAESLR